MSNRLSEPTKIDNKIRIVAGARITRERDGRNFVTKQQIDAQGVSMLHGVYTVWWRGERWTVDYKDAGTLL